MASLSDMKATIKVEVLQPTVWQLWLHDMTLGVFRTKRRALLALHRYRHQVEHNGFVWNHSKNGLRWWTTTAQGGRWISRLEVVEERLR